MSSIWPTEKNGAGRHYRPGQRYELVITILGNANDPTVKILNRMRSGTVIVYDNFHNSMEALGAFLADAQNVINGGLMATYGMACIIDTKDGGIHGAKGLTENPDKTPKEMS